MHTCSHFGSSEMGSGCTCSRQCLGYSSPQEGEARNPGVDGESPAWVEPESVAGRHYLTPLSSDWQYIWPNLRSYPNPTPLPGVRLEDPENYPFQSRVYELGEYDRRRGVRDNVYPEYCCLCEDWMDYYVPWGVCDACTGKVWRALLDQFSEAAWTIMDFLEPVPAYQCPECDPDWPGWYCSNCGHQTPEPMVSASQDWGNDTEAFDCLRRSAYQCPECDPDWPGWYCYNCGHQTPEPTVSASQHWGNDTEAFDCLCCFISLVVVCLWYCYTCACIAHTVLHNGEQ